MKRHTYITLALAVLFCSTVYADGYLRRLEDIQVTSADDLAFTGGEEEMEFGWSEEEECYFEEYWVDEEEDGMDDVDMADQIAMSNMNDDDTLGDVWVGNEEEFGWSEEEECYFEEYWVDEEEEADDMDDVDMANQIAMSNMNDDDMLDDSWVGGEEEFGWSEEEECYFEEYWVDEEEDGMDDVDMADQIAMSNMNDDDTLGDVWVGNEEEFGWSEEEECYFEEYWVDEEEETDDMDDVDMANQIAMSNMNDDDMLDDSWVGGEEEFGWGEEEECYFEEYWVDEDDMDDVADDSQNMDL